MDEFELARKRAIEQAERGNVPPGPSFDPSFYDVTPEKRPDPIVVKDFDEARRKAIETATQDKEASLDDIDLSTFVHEDPEGQAKLDANAVHKAAIGRVHAGKSTHWASGTFAACVRKEWLEYHGGKPTNPNMNPNIFAMGDAVESVVVNRYMLAGQLVRTQEHITITDPRLRMPITGKADLLIQENGDGLVVVEVKSIKGFGEREGYNLWKKYLPKPEHVAQITLYLKGLGLPFGYLTYFEKARALTVRFKVDFNQAFYERIVEYFVGLEEALAGPIPEIPRAIRGKNYPCIWWSQDKSHKEPLGTCPFFNLCWAEWPIEMVFSKNGERGD